MKDYDLEILYHPGKANVVADALSRKGQVDLAAMITLQHHLLEDMRQLDLWVAPSEELRGESSDTSAIVVASLVIQPTLVEEIRRAQSSDIRLERIHATAISGQRTPFRVDDAGMLRFIDRVCVPDTASLKDKILKEAHDSVYTIHPGEMKMYQDLKGFYWWRNMRREIARYVTKCLVCQKVKADRKRPPGLIQPLEKPEHKFDIITVDFVVGLPKTKSRDNTIWVIVDTLTKVAHFIPFRHGLSGEEMAMLYMKNQHMFHGTPTKIHEALRTEVAFSTAHHPQTDGQSERTIQTQEDMLRACALTMRGDWTDHLHIAEFSYNNSYHASIDMTPFKALYGHRVRTPVCWGPTSTIRLVPQMIEESAEKVMMIQERLKAA